MIIRESVIAVSVVCALVSSPFEAAAAGTVGNTTVGTTNYPIALDGRLLLESIDISPVCSLVLDDHLYLADTQGHLTQVDLQRFRRVKSLQKGLASQPDQGPSGCVEAGGFGYFVVNDTLAVRIVKVDLANLSIVDSTDLDIGFGFIRGFAAADGFLYLGVGGAEGSILKVDLATYTLVDTLALDVAEFGPDSAVFDGGFAYFGVSVAGGARVVKVDLATFDRVGSIDLASPPVSILGKAVALDGSGYFPVRTSEDTRIVKVDLTSLTRVDDLVIGSGGTSYVIVTSALVADGKVVFGVGYGSITGPPVVTGAVLSIVPDDFNIGSSIPIAGPVGPPWGAVEHDGHLYFAASTPSGFGPLPATLVKFDASTLAQEDSLALDSGEDFLPTGIRVGDQAYFAGPNSPAYVVQVDLTNLDRVRSLQFEPDEHTVQSAVAVEGHGYFGTFLGKVVKVDLANLTRVASLQLETGGLIAAMASGGFAFFVSDDVPAKLVKVELASFTQVASLGLPPRYGQIRSAVLEGAFAYLGNNLGDIVRIDLRTLSISKSIKLLPGETVAPSGAIVARGFAYFVGRRQQYFELIKIDLRTFKRVGAAVLNPREGELSGAIATDGRVAFLGTLRRGRVVRIDLKSLARTGALKLPQDFSLLGAVGNDDSAYFTANASSSGYGRGRVLRVPFRSLQGAIHATRAIVSETVTPRMIGFYAHEAGANVRLAIYDASKRLVWESPVIRVLRPNSVLSVNLSRGTPSQPFRLRRGTYYLAWQVDSNRAVPSYKRGATVVGWRLHQAFGPFPTQVAGEQSTDDTWTEFVKF